MARVNAKPIHTVQHIYLTTMTVLLLWQTQALYFNRVTASCPIVTSKKKTSCHLVIQSIKITSHVTCCALLVGKTESSVYFAARYIALLWLSFHLNRSVSSFVHL